MRIGDAAGEFTGSGAVSGEYDDFVSPITGDQQIQNAPGYAHSKFALDGHSGRRHAVTACRETQQLRHVAAASQPQAVDAASRGVVAPQGRRRHLRGIGCQFTLNGADGPFWG